MNNWEGSHYLCNNGCLYVVCANRFKPVFVLVFKTTYRHGDEIADIQLAFLALPRVPIRDLCVEDNPAGRDVEEVLMNPLTARGLAKPGAESIHGLHR